MVITNCITFYIYSNNYIYVIYKDFEKVLQNQIITRISTEPI